jgi:translation initiation factor IF-3
LIDEQGKQIGVVPREKALQMAEERGLDLVQITQKVEPPVCKILDYGKHLYQLKKKEKKSRTSSEEIKGIRLTFNISDHDLETRKEQTKKFLEKNYKVRIEMKLRGREKGLTHYAREKVESFLQDLDQELPLRVERELKREARGLTMIISKKT